MAYFFIKFLEIMAVFLGKRVGDFFNRGEKLAEVQMKDGELEVKTEGEQGFNPGRNKNRAKVVNYFIWIDWV